MAGFSGLAIGLVCAVAGMYLVWLSGKGDRAKASMLDELQNKFDEAQMRVAQLDEAQSKVAEAQTRIAQLEGEAQSKLDEEQMRAAQLDEAQSKVAAAQTRIAQLEEEAQSKLDEEQMRVAQSEEAQRKLAEAQARIAQLEEEAQSKLDEEQMRVAQSEEAQSKLAEAQTRVAQLEKEMERLRLLERFTPRVTVRGTPTNGQFITVTDSVAFRVTEMDYLTSSGVQITSEVVDRAGMSVQIPIDESRVTEVQKRGCNPEDGSFSMSFRIHVEVEGTTKTCLLPVRVAVNSAVKFEPMPLGTPLSKNS